VELEPKLIEGGLAVDDRGELGFVNDFDFSQVRRFYRVTNHQRGFVRAWHAHRKEAKYVTVMVGAAMVAAVRIDNWEKPSKDSKVYRHVLSANRPAVLYIPAGYANGFMTLTDNAALVFFSTATLQESRGDDIRYDARYWDPWQVIER
jgi:dTDP-4-dehydrorhamnose 3,5-epimerase-like enzyme